jgi:hypothetical protein
MPLPAMSGAEPPDGSNKPFLFAPNAAEPSMPIEPGNHCRFVGQDVAEDVAGDDHVERRRRRYELRCRIIDVQVRQLDIGIFGADPDHRVAPELRRLEHVGLVDAADLLAARAPP